MMKVCYSEMDTPAGLSCRLEAAGHAGYAPDGQDIVCAGASTVMHARVKLLPEALELMAKYEDGARDTLFPLLSTNRVRIDLITICKLAETSKTYSYHSGRHSFASLITLEAGVPMETICKMLGHKDVKMTQRYARVTQKKLFEDMDKFIAATEKDFILAL